MRSVVFILIVLSFATAVPVRPESPISKPQHFIYFGRDRERIKERAFLDHRIIAGAQLRYSWKELEPERDRYELQPLLDDIATLEQHGKRLFIQIQDASFSETVLVPDYLRTDPEFNGGAERKLEPDPRDPAKTRFDGWVARRWDPRVRDRFIRLLQEIAKTVDGKIEGINLAETAIGFEDVRHHPPGFTFENYEAAIRDLMTAARKAFTRSHVIVYANFMPGDTEGKPHLASIYAHAAAIGAGVGGPDLRPHRWGQKKNSLPLIATRKQGLIAGLAVQDGNLADVNPKSGKRVTVAELYQYASERLHLDYIFWGTQEPYYSEEILPYLVPTNEYRIGSPSGNAPLVPRM